MNNMVRVDRKDTLFTSLAKLLDGTGQNILNTGELLKMYNGSHLKFHMLEQDAFREL